MLSRNQQNIKSSDCEKLFPTCLFGSHVNIEPLALRVTVEVLETGSRTLFHLAHDIGIILLELEFSLEGYLNIDGTIKIVFLSACVWTVQMPSPDLDGRIVEVAHC